jgi:hypothetical protein
VSDVEVSLSDKVWQVPVSGPAPDRRRLQLWAELVRVAQEPCLVLDRAGLIMACSAPAVSLLGLPELGTALGRGLLDGILHLVDFTAAGRRLSEWELARIPPMLTLATGGLARGLIRIRLDHATRTVDAVTTPLRDCADLAGSLTFFHPI